MRCPAEEIYDDEWDVLWYFCAPYDPVTRLLETLAKYDTETLWTALQKCCLIPYTGLTKCLK